MTKDYSALQNGSDIRGVAMGPADKVILTAEAVSRLAEGFLCMLINTCGKPAPEIKIAVGRDSRLTGEALEQAICRTLSARGALVLSCGLASTPAMFMSTAFPEFGCTGAIMITASHMPSVYNGLKFFNASGGLNKEDITDIINFAESDRILAETETLHDNTSDIVHADLMSRYAKHLRDIIRAGCRAANASDRRDCSTDCDPDDFSDAPAYDDSGCRPLSRLKITVDAGNGAGGFYATEVLEPLGADISSSQFLQPDGTFPNRIPNPENQEAMSSVRSAVLASGSDLGLIFDTDVDRASAVDENGREINRNRIVALAAALIADDNPGTTVVTDSVTSPSLTDFLEHLGLRHLRYKRGYRNVINKAIELNKAGTDSALAIETSGHAAYRENYFLDDGAYLATKIVVQAAKLKSRNRHISSVISDMTDPVEEYEVRLPITDSDFAAESDAILAFLSDTVSSGGLAGAELETPNYEGVRISFTSADTDGWLLIRKSLHEPIMPVNMESNVPGGCSNIRSALRSLLSGFPSLDISKL